MTNLKIHRIDAFFQFIDTGRPGVFDGDGDPALKDGLWV